jgi:lysophospholipase L1-like esterase
MSSNTASFGGRGKGKRGGRGAGFASGSGRGSGAQSKAASAAVPVSSSKQPRTTKAAYKERSYQTNQEHLKEIEASSEVEWDVLMLGSSMFERWKTTGAALWEEFITPKANLLDHSPNKKFLNVFNAGVGGDKTQSALFRLEEGRLLTTFEHFKPKFVILLIGTNNLECDSGEDIALGVDAIVKKLIADLPSLLQITVIGSLPRSFQSKNEMHQARSTTLNKILESNYSSSSSSSSCVVVKFKDASSHFLMPDGSLAKSKYVDHVHFNREGYEAFVKPIVEILEEFKQVLRSTPSKEDHPSQ